MRVSRRIFGPFHFCFLLFLFDSFIIFPTQGKGQCRRSGDGATPDLSDLSGIFYISTGFDPS